jgi:hypothetical protein
MANDSGRKFVIRTDAPVRRWLLIGAGVLVVGIGLYLTYELGRFDAGYDRQAVAQTRTENRIERERLERDNHELRVKIAQFETARVGSTREQAEVARTIGELQAQVARQAQDLAFLRGIVQQSALAPEVKIQELRLAATDSPGHFQVRLNVVQAVRPENVVSGAIDVQVEGVDPAGHPAALVLGDLTAGKRLELAYSFRYFQRFDEPISLPEGFRPERVTVALRSSRKGVAPVTQTFPWTVDAA